MIMDPINEKRIDESIEKVLKIINKSKLNIPELIVFYGRLGYNIGAGMAGLKESGPNFAQIQQEYYRNPTVDVGLMMQGLIIQTWTEGYEKKPVLSSYAKNNNVAIETKKE
jgi:hypothetical protein